MRTSLRFALLAAVLGLVQSAPDPESVRRLEKDARGFVATLDEAKRGRAGFALADAVRKDWHYVPRDRPGLRVGDLDDAQAKAFRLLLDSTLSDAGLRKVDGVIQLEAILREVEHSPARDPGRFAISMFGEPGSGEPWGWRFEGHHLSLNLSVADGHVAVTPLFLGANPGVVADGPQKGLRVLGEEEDVGFALASSLDERQRAKGVHEKDVPTDVILGPGRAASFLEPPGIASSELDASQRARLAQLVALYTGDLEAGLEGEALERARAASNSDLHFLWIGPVKLGEPHYWRVQGPSFAIELDDVQGGANHVHTLWRDLKDDFGEDLLLRHRQEQHGKK
jgi:hypothetical protein